MLSFKDNSIFNSFYFYFLLGTVSFYSLAKTTNSPRLKEIMLVEDIYKRKLKGGKEKVLDSEDGNGVELA